MLEKTCFNQKEIADKNSVVMEGRDITTVVLPDADYKFYLSASPEIRAKRRTLQLKEKGLNADYEEILRDIKNVIIMILKGKILP